MNSVSLLFLATQVPAILRDLDKNTFIASLLALWRNSCFITLVSFGVKRACQLDKIFNLFGSDDLCVTLYVKVICVIVFQKKLRREQIKLLI